MSSNKYIWLLFLFLPMLSHGQLNIKIGYGMAYTSGNGYNDLLDEFNTENDYRIEQKLSSLHILHGVELGIRYGFDQYGLEFAWESHGSDGLAVGEDLDGSLYEKEMFYGFNTISLGLERYFGNKGIGMSGGIRKGSFKGSINGSDVKKTFVSDSQYVIKAYWMLNFKGGDIIGLSLRPYISVPLNSLDFQSEGSYPVHDHLGIAPSNVHSKARLPMVGVSILFYNGWQN